MSDMQSTYDDRSEDRFSYERFLQLGSLLDSQHAFGNPGSAADGVELFFIVAHQTCELWLKSLLSELQLLDDALAEFEVGDRPPKLHAQRALAAGHALVACTDVLSALDTTSFASFRLDLGTSSGAQSRQFRRLWHVVGLGSPDGGPVEARLRSFLAAHRHCCGGGIADIDGIHEILLDLSSVLWRWSAIHIDVTYRLIQADAGTGETSGVAYLLDGLKHHPFPTLFTSAAK